MAEQIVKTLRGTPVRLLHPIFNSSGAITQYLVMMASGTRCPVSVEDLDIKDPEILKQIQKGIKMSEEQGKSATDPQPAATNPQPILNPVLPANVIVTPVVKRGRGRPRKEVATTTGTATAPTATVKVSILPPEPVITQNPGKEQLNIAEPVKQRKKREPKVVDPAPVTKKRRGRPPKTVTTAAPAAAKRRGRPPKVVETGDIPPKVKKGKRGRPAKIVEAPAGEITLSIGRGPVPKILKDNIKLIKQIGVISKENKLAVTLLKLLKAHM